MVVISGEFSAKQLICDCGVATSAQHLSPKAIPWFGIWETNAVSSEIPLLYMC
jgi:hypothetical protein